MIDLDIQPYIARLQGSLTGMQEVAGAAELDRAMTDHVTPPAAYVVYTGADAQPEQLRVAGAHEQQVTATFEVFLCAQNVAGRFGGAAADAMAPLRLAVLAALVGYTPDAAELDPITRLRDRLWLFDDGRIWWRITFSTAFAMRITPESP